MEQNKSERKNIMVIIKNEIVECWGSLTEVCDQHPDFSYDYLKRKKLPIKYKGFSIQKVPFKIKRITNDEN